GRAGTAVDVPLMRRKRRAGASCSMPVTISNGREVARQPFALCDMRLLGLHALGALCLSGANGGMCSSPRAASAKGGLARNAPAAPSKRPHSVKKIASLVIPWGTGCARTAVLLHGFAVRRLSVPADRPTQ